MTIKEKTVTVKLHNSVINHYKNLNYQIPTKINKIGKIVYDFEETMEVKVEDLPKGSHVSVTKICDYNIDGCTVEVANQWYQAVLRQRKNDGKDACYNCAYKIFIDSQSKIKKLKIIKIIKDRFNKGLNLNSKNIQKEDTALYSTACNFFGSWENAINESGINYDEVREDHYRMGYYGQQFEKILGKILKDIYGRSIKKGYDKSLQPDFNFGDKTWMDAKLSEWTVYGSETINKYEPHCNKLTIVYLRGDKNKEEQISDKTNIISVYMVIKSLSTEKQNYYITLLDKLCSVLNNQQEENYNNMEIQGDPSNPVGYKGVHWSNAKKRWCTEIIINKKKIWIGQFTSEMECAEAYDTFVLENEIPRPINFGENPLYKGKTSKHNGVHWDTRKNKWIAASGINNKRKHIGNFESELEAAKAYNGYLIESNSNNKLNIIE